MKKKKENKFLLPRESQEERKERISKWRCTATKVVPSKKVYNRKKLDKIVDND